MLCEKRLEVRGEETAAQPWAGLLQKEASG